MAITCSSCNAEIDDDARFCPKCGTPTANAQKDESTDPTIAVPKPEQEPAPVPPTEAVPPVPPPRTAVAPGAMRQDLVAAAQRDLRKGSSPVLVRLEEALRDDERVDALAACDPDGAILAVTDQRLLLVAPAAPAVERPYGGLRDVVALPFAKQAIVCALAPGQPFDGWVTKRDAAKNVVSFARERLAQLRGDGTTGGAWHDDASFMLSARYDDAALVVAPDGADIPGRTAVIASFVTTGVQLTTVGTTQGAEPTRTFLPWSSVSGATLEPPDQSMSRPGFAEAVELGVPGASTRGANRRASLALTTGGGDYVLVLRGYTLDETAAALAPLLDHMPGAKVSQPSPPPPPPQAAPAPAPAGAGDPVAQIRQLGELRDEGLLTPEEFEAKKAQILDRM